MILVSIVVTSSVFAKDNTKTLVQNLESGNLNFKVKSLDRNDILELKKHSLTYFLISNVKIKKMGVLLDIEVTLKNEYKEVDLKNEHEIVRQFAKEYIEKNKIVNVKDAMNYYHKQFKYDEKYFIPSEVIKEGKSNCSGYAWFFKAYLDKLGMNNYLHYTKSNGVAHVVNVTLIDDMWYLIDVSVGEMKLMK